MFVVVTPQASRLLLARKAGATSKCSTRQVYPPTEFVHQRFRGQEPGTGCLYCRILLKMQLKNVEMYLSCYRLSICWQLILEKSWFTVQGLAWTVIRYPYMGVHFRDSCLLFHCVAFHFSGLRCWLNIFSKFYNRVFKAVLDIDTEWKPTWTPLTSSVSSRAVALCPAPAGSEVRLVRMHTAVYLFMEIAASVNRGSKYSRAGHSCKQMHWLLSIGNGQAWWWCMPGSPELERLRQEDHEWKASLGHRVRVCLQKNGGKEGKTRERKKNITVIIYWDITIPEMDFFLLFFSSISLED